jgi:predicted NAD-dependent protein-ADP-ribosyltransferase YbiA (DUF1768 family)
MISVSGHPTYRIVDGERIEGTLRPVFIDNGGYHLTELMIYADGLIDCWELVDLEGFRKKVRSGWVATSIPEGAKGSAFPLASWRFAEPKAWVDADDLVGEVADEIERLNGRPTTKTRCLEALERYREQPTESRRRELSAAYLAIPSHERDYILGDMDARDWPLRVLASKVGKKALGVGPTRVVTEENRASALAYFEERERETAAWNEETNGRDPEGPSGGGPATIYFGTGVLAGRPADYRYLENGFRAKIEVEGLVCPTITHAYWALSTDDLQVRSRILRVRSPRDARKLGIDAPRLPGWPAIRLNVMTTLVRAKFHQHPKLAKRLRETGHARLVDNDDLWSAYWGNYHGRNWLGRILELVRAELMVDGPSPRSGTGH